MQRVDLQPGDSVGNRYRIEKSLGEGTFGQVFKVADSSNGSTAALKLLKMWCISPDERKSVYQRFEMEYTTGRINSPYLVHSIARGTHFDNPYIVMEYCPGGDLQHAAQQGHLDYALVASQVLEGLGALHHCGKVHRDLKPENVLLRADGTAVLTDFGISGDQNNRLTKRGILGTPKEIMGTFIYMPPEQVRPPSGNATVLPTTDIFSFGVMMYQIITGQLPFGPLQTDDDMERYCENGRTGRWNRQALQNANGGQQWLAVIEGCLQPNYKRRLQSVAEVMRMLPPTHGKPRHTPYSGMAIRRLTSANHWQLRIMQGEEVGRLYPLDPRRAHGTVLTMGRQAEALQNDLPLVEEQSTYISRAHCTLEWDSSERRWYLWDGQWRADEWRPSLNGTFVGSKQATSTNPIALTEGDIIAVGDVTLRVEVGD